MPLSSNINFHNHPPTIPPPMRAFAFMVSGDLLRMFYQDFMIEVPEKDKLPNYAGYSALGLYHLHGHCEGLIVQVII